MANAGKVIGKGVTIELEGNVGQNTRYAFGPLSRPAVVKFSCQHGL